MAVESSKSAFSLVDHNGRAVQETDFRGKCTLVFFGFTHCAVVCPRALERLIEILNRLGTGASRFNALYVSVDPERDTPGVMKAFLHNRAPHFTGLSGTQEQVDSARKAFRVFAQRKDDDTVPEGYTIPHTALTYVLGPDGCLVDHLNDSLDVENAVKRLRQVLARDSDSGSTGPTASPRLNPDSSAIGQESLALLDKKQVASIRHTGNLARQLKGDLSNMMG